MSELLLVPIHVDALCVSDSGAKAIAPLADFTQIPYACWVTRQLPHKPPTVSSVLINSDEPFTSQNLMRKPARLASYHENYVPRATGIHLHWSLPDALTVMRADPDSNNRLRFPQVPNRWLITSKTKSNNEWKVEAQWIVESDYLYPEEATLGGLKQRTAITFPIVPLERYQRVLTNPPPKRPDKPSDVTDPDYNAVYSAPFRYMGRNQQLADWQNNSKSSDYLYQFMPDGLTAVGYGDPLFAAIYSNCSSVFGFVDTSGTNKQVRRYDILGWYENTPDCMDLFLSLFNQKPDTELYKALTAAYKWKVTDPPKDFPTFSLYYASVDVEPNLTVNPALDGTTRPNDGPPGYSQNSKSRPAVAVGNTGTEALSADLAATLADGNNDDRFIMEDQLEAIGLRHELGDVTVDLEARFLEARHTKGFQPRTGGTLWSIQVRSTDTTSGNQLPSQQTAIPADLAHALNELNLRQADYDAAWQDIETLRHRVFADWYKFDNAYNFATQRTVIYTSPKDVPPAQRHQDPKLDPTWVNLRDGNISLENFIGDQDEILPYILEGSLQLLQQRVAVAGVIEIGKDDSGQVTFTATNASNNPYVANKFTLAQSVLLQLQSLTSQVDAYNAALQQKKVPQQFAILRKSAPRFWQPSEPAVLLKGAAVPSTPRHGEDGRANDDDTLTCHVLNVSTTLDKGGIS